jgi:hypothetical protein
MSLHAESVPTLSRTLENMSKWLDQASKDAEERGFDVSRLLEARLAPDQFNLTRNIQSACDTGKFVATRMGGIEAAAHEDGPATVAELQTRIAEVRALLAQVSPEAFETKRDATLTLMRGMTMSGQAYVRQFAMPNFFFHAATSYAILRHNGVKLGKRDFLGAIDVTPAPQKE